MPMAWARSATSGGVAIGGATASMYTLGDADVGSQISVTASYTDGQGTAESVTSDVQPMLSPPPAKSRSVSKNRSTNSAVRCLNSLTL